MDNFDKALYDVYLQNEESAGMCLLLAAGSEAEDGGDGSGVRRIAEECKKRGIDPGKAISVQIDRQNRIWKLFNG